MVKTCSKCEKTKSLDNFYVKSNSGRFYLYITCSDCSNRPKISKPFGEIYQITNLKNNLKYIGQTILPIGYRFNGHMQSAKNKKDKRKNSKFYIDLLEYGYKGFEIKSLQVCNNKKELDEAEKFWIKKNNTIWPNGYNVSNCEKAKRTETTQIIWEDINEEGFVNIIDFPGYEINIDGEVYAKKRIIEFNQNGSVVKTNRNRRKMMWAVKKDGYPYVNLSKHGVAMAVAVHILVAKAFIGAKSNDAPLVNHKDGNRLNANVNNLEYVNGRENSLHHLNKRKSFIEVYDNKIKIKQFKNTKEAAKAYECDIRLIQSACRTEHKVRKLGGIIFKKINNE